MENLEGTINTLNTEITQLNDSILSIKSRINNQINTLNDAKKFCDTKARITKLLEDFNAIDFNIISEELRNQMQLHVDTTRTEIQQLHSLIANVNRYPNDEQKTLDSIKSELTIAENKKEIAICKLSSSKDQLKAMILEEKVKMAERQALIERMEQTVLNDANKQ